jgi:hypothetical protein
MRKTKAFGVPERMLEPPYAPMSRTDDRNFRTTSNGERDVRSRILSCMVQSIFHCTEGIEFPMIA